MGNQKFRLSDMIPNAWFYKLRDMGKTRNHRTNQNNSGKKKQTPTPSNSSSLSSNSSSSLFSSSISTSIPPKTTHDQPPNVSHHRKSNYFTRDLSPPPQPPIHHQKFYIQSPEKPPKQNIRTGGSHDHRPSSMLDSSSGFENNVFDMKNKSLNSNFDGFRQILKIELPPIITKKKPEAAKETERISTSTSRSAGAGVRLRSNSPRIKKIEQLGLKKSGGGRRRRRVPESSIAVVKSSADPLRDFRESMLEMILQNGIEAPKDLEDLLVCYLQLNSDEYHDLIIKVFKQIWFDLVS